MHLSTAWLQLALSETHPVPTPPSLCVWSCLTCLPKTVQAISSLVFQGTGIVPSMHSVSKHLGYSLKQKCQFPSSWASKSSIFLLKETNLNLAWIFVESLTHYIELIWKSPEDLFTSVLHHSGHQVANCYNLNLCRTVLLMRYWCVANFQLWECDNSNNVT